MDRYHILQAFGIEVHPSQRIQGDALIIDGHPIVLIRHDLTPEEHSDLAHDLLAALPDLVRSLRPAS